MRGKILLILVMLILIANASSAVKLYSADFNIVKNKAVVEVNIVFNEKTTDMIEFELPADYKALSVYVDNKLISPEVEDNVLKLELKENSKISYNYVTQEFIDKSNFLMNLRLDFDVDDLLIKLVLPEGDKLKKPIQEGDLTSGSIYPKPSEATTDGRSLIFYWLEKDMKKGDEISIFTQIEPEKNPILAVIFVIVITALLSVYFLRKKPKQIVSKPNTKVIVKKEDMVEKHLKEDEKAIVDVLKLKEGSCEQGTLRVATGFSKATLSRLLKELEDRKVIFKEKRGKKNLVFLQK